MVLCRLLTELHKKTTKVVPLLWRERYDAGQVIVVVRDFFLGKVGDDEFSTGESLGKDIEQEIVDLPKCDQSPFRCSRLGLYSHRRRWSGRQREHEYRSDALGRYGIRLSTHLVIYEQLSKQAQVLAKELHSLISA
jgi:hypothetical protein